RRSRIRVDEEEALEVSRQSAPETGAQRGVLRLVGRAMRELDQEVRSLPGVDAARGHALDVADSLDRLDLRVTASGHDPIVLSSATRGALAAACATLPARTGHPRAPVRIERSRPAEPIEITQRTSR